MKLEVLKCPSCGANIEFAEEVECCECEYCGAKVTRTTAQNKKINNANETSNNSISNTNISKLNLKKAKSSVSKTVRKGLTFIFNALFIANLFFTGILLISAIATKDASIVFGALFCLIYAAMFKVLALTPKGSKYILGKARGLKPIYFVLICIFLSFMLFMISPTEDTTDTNNDTVITSEEFTIEQQ